MIVWDLYVFTFTHHWHTLQSRACASCMARMCRVFLSDMSDVWCIIQKAKHKLLHFLEQNVRRMCACILQSCWEEVSAGTVQG